MREFLTIVACLLVALLTAALAGPWLVDWTAHREVIEAQLSDAVGARVTTHGGIDLKLLPTPRLELEGVDIAETGGASLKSGNVTLELSITPLLRGELRLLEASFERPTLSLSQGKAAGAPAMAAGSTDIRFERIAIHDGEIRLQTSNGAIVSVAHVDLTAEAASLSGPFKGSGSFARNGDTVGFRFTTGAFDDQRMRVKFVSDEAGGLPRADFDGALTISTSGAGWRGLLEGPLSMSGRGFDGWRATGALKLDESGATLDPVDVKAGGDDAALALAGAASVAFGANSAAQVTLAARQFDADRLIAANAKPWGAAALQSLVSELAEKAAIPVHATVSTPALQLGGETLTGVVADIRVAQGVPPALRLEGSGPGRSHLLLDGNIETGAAPRFTGRVDAAVRDLARFANWLAAANPETADRLRATPFRSLEAVGDLDFSAAGFSARNISAKADRSALRGSLSVTRAIGDARGRFFADVTSDAVDLDAVPDLTSFGAALAAMDFNIGLEARAVRVARFRDGVIDAGRIRLRAAREGEATTVETFSLADIGGATFEANAQVDAGKAKVNGRLDAQRLSDLAALIKRVAPGVWSDALAARAVALSPARIGFELDASPMKGQTGWRVEHLKVDGTARGSKMVASIRPDVDEKLAGDFALESPDGSLLVRQIGFESLPLTGSGAGRLSAKLRGDFERGFDITSAAQIAGTRLSFSGRAGVPPMPVNGEVKVESNDAAPFLRLMTFGMPDAATSLPLALSARLSTANGGVRIADIAGSAAGSNVRGELSAVRDASDRLRFSGSLGLDRVSLPALYSLALGPLRAARAGSIWSDARFAVGLSNAPLADVDIEAGQVQIMESVATTNARFHLGLSDDAIRLADIKATMGEASIDGRVALRRDGASAALSGVLGITNLRVANADYSAQLDGRFDFSSTGASPAEIAAGLAGSGKGSIRNLEIRRFDSAAPARVIAQTDNGDVNVSENDFIGALRREFGKADFSVATRDLDATLAGGVIRSSEAAGVSVAFDLRTFSADVRASIAASPLPKDWAGVAPRITLILRGPVTSPRREIEAGAFVSALSARAVAREAAHIEALEADIRERAYFVRRQKGLAFLRTREREIAAFETEQARLAAEAERRRIAEEARAERERQEQIERERQERLRRAAEARRREAEAARAAAQTPLRLQVVPGVNDDPSAAGRY